MKVCMFGAGAIGGYVGALLHRQGVEVSLIARGPHLAAMQDNGLTVHSKGERFVAHPQCSDNPADLGPQDYIFITLKAHALAGVIDDLGSLLKDDTAIVGAQNGLPWWYFYRHGGAYDGRRLSSVDPNGRLWDGLGPERMLGAVVWPSAELAGPGVVEHSYGDRIPLGEPDGSRSDRALTLSKALIAAGIKSPVRPNIRTEIWMKLWGNLSFNPLSVLTMATLQDLATDPGTRRVTAVMMTEAKTAAEKLGIKFPIDVGRRIDMAADVGEHKTSMLQDLERGRTMEIEPLLGVVAEVGRMIGVPMPTIDIVYDLVVKRAKEAGCYAG